MTKTLKLLVALLFWANLCIAQQFNITGKVTDKEGVAIPFASVIIKNTSKGVSANEQGIYSIKTDNSEITLIFKAIGYKTNEKQLHMNAATTTLNCLLEAEHFTLNSITIKAGGEDPAYRIIREAIKKRKYHLNEVNSYSRDVYIKGMQKLVGAPKKFFGRDIQKLLSLDTNRSGILYLSESQSHYYFEKPNKIREEMFSSKVSGRNNAFSYNKASDLQINFYDNLLLESSGLSSRSFVSPIADNALFYYKYKLLGSTNENDVIIHKIAVEPKRKNDPAFRGIIYIADELWRLTGVNVNLTSDAGINLLDTLNITQQFVKVDKFYMPSTIQFGFNGNVLGFKFKGYYVGMFSNYTVNQQFPKDFFTSEILKITKAVNKKDSLYWAENRPIPLTQEEKLDYKKKDSIAVLKESKHYLDSVEKVNNNFTLGKILITSYSHNNRYEKTRYDFDPLVRSVLFNTVEGFAFKYGVTFTKRLEDRKYYSIRPDLRYGLANKTFTATLSGNYYYDPVKRAQIGGSFGSSINDLNNYGSMDLLSNSINSLVFETNLSKFYKKEFGNVFATRELANGLQAYLSLSYANNHALINHSNTKIRDLANKEYTSNNPFTPNVETYLFPDYQSAKITAQLSYAFGQKYITRPDGKFYTESKYPRITVEYRKGIKNLFNSDVDYDFISAEVSKENISSGLWGYSSFTIGGGIFLNNNSLFYPEFKHFRGNSSLVFPPNLRKFRYLDFYLYSTSKHYFEAHYEHNFAGFITNKIPLLRKLKLEEYVGVNFLTQPDKRNYTEFFFGLQRLLFSVSYGYAYDGNKKVQQGFRIAYGF